MRECMESIYTLEGCRYFMTRRSRSIKREILCRLLPSSWMKPHSQEPMLTTRMHNANKYTCKPVLDGWMLPLHKVVVGILEKEDGAAQISRSLPCSDGFTLHKPLYLSHDCLIGLLQRVLVIFLFFCTKPQGTNSI